ncbi:hypothetical protein BU23DRAFT_293090 [Bimuria novae-zelandiae CBS 107.79]|uniref:non-specific serine/threonine protein kinase n=1 Tax=Bimuria novae-zelandiae CBS 107.79 TaxID=1447943 RepID=A0A6A5UTH6_9PLEO|nr:hypothetical protein BU23DRAFT_293090 [Bimuria novae-zelandiae CBS 107.79]
MPVRSFDPKHQKTPFGSIVRIERSVRWQRCFHQRHIPTHIPEGMLWTVLWEQSLALCYLQTGINASRFASEGKPIRRRREGWEAILHRDVKPANIFLTTRDQENQYPTTVLGDFGCSVMVRDRVSSVMTAWTKPFAAPEEPRYTEMSDVYSLALSVHCMAIVRDMPDERREVRKANPAPGYSCVLNDLLARCLSTRPGDRPDVGYLPYLVLRE